MRARPVVPDFEDFIERMSLLDYKSMVAAATEECTEAEHRRLEATDGLLYAPRIKSFLYFIRTNTRPSGASAADFMSYRRVVESLVASGEFRPEALAVFANSAMN